MAALIEGVLAASLQRNRDRLNQIYHAAAAGGQAVDRQELADHLQRVVRPIAEAVAGEDEASVDRVVVALFQLSVELFRSGLLGSRSRLPLVSEAWLAIAPKIPGLLRYESRRTVGALTNAVVNVAAVGEGPARQWVAMMGATASLTKGLDEFLALGRVAAWRCGVAHLRPAAIEAIVLLPAAAGSSIFGVSESEWPALSERLRRDPWLTTPDSRLQLIGSVGAFRGFGGEMLRPPVVSSDGSRVFVHDGQRTWRLWADRFGGTLTPAPSRSPVPNGGEWQIDRWGDVSSPSGKASIPLLAESSSRASDGTFLAVTLPLSHSVYIVGPA
jgi:hypothetical protein